MKGSRRADGSGGRPTARLRGRPSPPGVCQSRGRAGGCWILAGEPHGASCLASRMPIWAETARSEGRQLPLSGRKTHSLRQSPINSTGLRRRSPNPSRLTERRQTHCSTSLRLSIPIRKGGAERSLGSRATFRSEGAVTPGGVCLLPSPPPGTRGILEGPVRSFLHEEHVPTTTRAQA